MRISDWSSDVCSSDLMLASPAVNSYAVAQARAQSARGGQPVAGSSEDKARKTAQDFEAFFMSQMFEFMSAGIKTDGPFGGHELEHLRHEERSEEHTSELQSLMRKSYAVFCLKKKKYRKHVIANPHKSTNQKLNYY